MKRHAPKQPVGPLPWTWSDEKHKPDKDHKTQETEQGFEIPVPSREDFFGNLEKVSKPDQPAE